MIGGIGGYNPLSGYGSSGYGAGSVRPGGEKSDFNIPGQNGSGEESNLGKVGDDVKKPGRKSSPEDCETCKNRKYQDGSDESDVSFQTPQHIDPSAAASAVRAHEQEHVVNAYEKAKEEGGKVLSVGVSIHTAVCPECGRVYVSGGLTTSRIATPEGDDNSKNNPYDQQKDALGRILNTGMRANYTT